MPNWSKCRGPLSALLHLGITGLALQVAGCGSSTGTPTPSKNALIDDRSIPRSIRGYKTRAEHLASRKVPEHAQIAGDRLAGSTTVSVKPTRQTEPSPFRFSEIARQSGIDFVQFSGMGTEKHFPTANGSGVAMFDADGDGKLDLYFATGNRLPLGDHPEGRHVNRLYKNLGGGKFRDITSASGLGFEGYCHGAIVGDIDNDGDPDVFLANHGPNALYLNNGDGTFRDIAREAGTLGREQSWSSSGAFLDIDNDGDLDLYVANYGEWIYPKDDVYCGDKEKGVRFYCSPRIIRTVKHYLYRNNGDRTFTDVTDAAGVGRSDGPGFGVVAADLNGDGRTGLYVANDMNPNFLFLNKGDGTFEDATEASGAAFDEKGQAQSGMGVDAEDINGDGTPELFVTNFANEYNTLYLNLGKGLFVDSTPYFGLAADTMINVGWGCTLADFDNDGWPDNFVTNGHVDDNRAELGQSAEYAESPALFYNLGGKRFRLATREAGPYFDSKHVGRGAAFGDFDDDGDIDLVVNHKDSPPALLRNDTKTENRWIRLDLRGTKSNRDAVGARIEAVIAADALGAKPSKPAPNPDGNPAASTTTIYRQRKGGTSMESSHDPRILIGVGRAEEVIKLTVRWPSGAVTTLEHLPTNRTHSIVEPK